MQQTRDSVIKYIFFVILLIFKRMLNKYAGVKMGNKIVELNDDLLNHVKNNVIKRR